MNHLRGSELASFLVAHEHAFICFTREGDGPCAIMLDTLRSASPGHPQVGFALVDVDGEAEVAGDFEVTAVPTLAGFKRRHLAYLEAGALDAEGVAAVIASVIAAPVPKPQGKR